jgi:phosphoglycerol transferase MdoB-like AlkP superfamily enzyme
LAVGLVLFLIEWKNRQAFVVWDVLLMIAAGTIGIVLTMMLFSQHPTVSLNLQIILFNPLPWFFLWPVIRGRKTCYWMITAILCLLFLIGALFQSYAEGICGLALCLLFQSIIHLYRVRQ